MLHIIKNDANTSLLHICCLRDLYLKKMVIYSDFFSLKTISLPPDFRFTRARNRERAFRYEMKKLILDKEHRHVQDSCPKHKR